MGATIKDIAKLANVSHTTVSRALNDSRLIKAETKERVRAAARELNYVPNYAAKSLVQNRSYTIGLFFSTFASTTASQFLFDTIRGVKEGISSQYNLVVDSIESHTDLSGIHRRRFDGIIVMSQSDADDLFITHVLDRGIPLVVLNRSVTHPNIINILSSDRQGAYEAVHHLIDHGYRDIAIIAGYKPFGATQERLAGYMEALADRAIPVKEEYIVEGDFTTESGYDAMITLLRTDSLPTAVFCCNDMMAVGALKAMAQRGLSVPEDMAVVGFDDSGIGAFLTPGLTTVRRHLSRISKVGTEQLLSWIENTNAQTGEKLYIPTSFVPRESVGQVVANS